MKNRSGCGATCCGFTARRPRISASPLTSSAHAAVTRGLRNEPARRHSDELRVEVDRSTAPSWPGGESSASMESLFTTARIPSSLPIPGRGCHRRRTFGSSGKSQSNTSTPATTLIDQKKRAQKMAALLQFFSLLGRPSVLSLLLAVLPAQCWRLPTGSTDAEPATYRRHEHSPKPGVAEHGRSMFVHGHLPLPIHRHNPHRHNPHTHVPHSPNCAQSCGCDGSCDGYDGVVCISPLGCDDSCDSSCECDDLTQCSPFPPAPPAPPPGCIASCFAFDMPYRCTIWGTWCGGCGECRAVARLELALRRPLASSAMPRCMPGATSPPARIRLSPPQCRRRTRRRRPRRRWCHRPSRPPLWPSPPPSPST